MWKKSSPLTLSRLARSFVRVISLYLNGIFRLFPKEPELQYFLVLRIAAPQGGVFSANNKVYLGQSGKYYILKYLLDPETIQIEYPFTVGELQRRTINGQLIDVGFHAIFTAYLMHAAILVTVF